MKYFGTDGIRQKADLFDSAFLQKIVYGLVEYGREKVGDKIRVMVGGDTRESSEWIIQDLCAALESLGIEYSSVGVLPTPAIGYCFYEMGFDFAIDVTASHNPWTDNGVKIFERFEKRGEKLSDRGREVIENALNSDITFNNVAVTLREDLHDEALEIYKEHILNYVDECDLSGMKIGMDCANGATSVINKTILEKLGANVTVINCDEHYGQNINSGCGSTHMEAISELAKQEQFDFCVAFDGDGDRSLFLDENGELVDGDQIIAIVSTALGIKNVAATVTSNQGLFNWAKDNDVHVEVTPVGDHNIVVEIIEGRAQLGAEQNGHIILPDTNGGDGLLVATELAKLSYGKKLSKLASVITKTPQVSYNIVADASKKELLKTSDEIHKILLDYNKQIEDKGGRLFVHPSGTENFIRVYVWSDTIEDATNLLNSLVEKLESALQA